jgi:hypothetical protein
MPNPHSNSSLERPLATRPVMPGYGILDALSGEGLLPWNWALDHVLGSSAAQYMI